MQLFSVKNVYIKKQDKIVPDGARLKNCWFYLASWTRNLQETSRKLSRWCQTAPEFPFVYKKKTESGVVWHNLANFPTNFWCRKPDRTSHFFVWLRLASSGMVLSGTSGLGVTTPLSRNERNAPTRVLQADQFLFTKGKQKQIGLFARPAELTASWLHGPRRDHQGLH